MGNAKLLKAILERDEIILPQQLFKQDFLIDIEKGLDIASLTVLAHKFYKASINIDQFLEINNFSKYIDNLALIYQENTKQYGYLLSKDDELVLEFLKNNTKTPITDFFSTFGQTYFILELLNDLNSLKEELPKNIVMALFFYIFTNTFELILLIVDRKIFNYITENNITVDQKFINNIDRNLYQHAMPAQLSNILEKVVPLNSPNNSIFGVKSGPKILRNKISHSNLFYDSEKNVVIVDKEEYSVEEFIKEYFHLFQFLITWIEKCVNTNISDPQVKSQLILTIKNYFKLSSRQLRSYKIHGYDRYFNSYIIKLKKET